MTPEKKLIVRFLAMFGEPKSLDPDQFIKDFTKAIEGYAPDLLEMAGDAVIRKNTFWPKPAEVIAEAVRIGGLKGDVVFEFDEEQLRLNGSIVGEATAGGEINVQWVSALVRVGIDASAQGYGFQFTEGPNAGDFLPHIYELKFYGLGDGQPGDDNIVILDWYQNVEMLNEPDRDATFTLGLRRRSPPRSRCSMSRPSPGSAVPPTRRRAATNRAGPRPGRSSARSRACPRRNHLSRLGDLRGRGLPDPDHGAHRSRGDGCDPRGQCTPLPRHEPQRRA